MSKTKADDKLVSIADAAAYLGVNERTIRNMLTDGRLKAYVTGQVVAGSQGWPSASMTKVSKKFRPCLAAVDR